MTSGHRWAFKARFRAGAYSWHGSALARKRLKEAVREINSVAKSAPVLAAEGCVSLTERLRPALQHIDTSSDALGALDYAAHQLIVSTSATKRSSDFIAFLGRLDAIYRSCPGHPDKPAVFVLDNARRVPR